MNLKPYILSFILITSIILTDCKKKDKDTDNSSTSSLYATVSTNPISSVSATAAVCGGNITSQGASAIIAVGVCWDTNPSPTTVTPHTNNGISTGTYTSSITGLLPNTTYYVRAYATNASGIAYGNEISFKTNPSWMAVGTVTSNASGQLIVSGNILFCSNYNTSNNTFIARSHDNGATWTPCNNGLGSINTIYSFFSFGSNLFVGTNAGVYKSVDNGDTWTPTNNTNLIRCFGSIGNVVFASDIGTNYSTTDLGNNWATLNSLPNPAVCYITVGNTIMAATYGSSCYKSIDNGNSWTVSNGGLATTTYFTCFARVGNRIFLGSFNKGLYFTDDFGNTWAKITTLNGSHIFSMASNGNTIYAEAGNGIFTSTDLGMTWTAFNQGLSVSAISMVIKDSILIASDGSNIYNYKL